MLGGTRIHQPVLSGGRQVAENVITFGIGSTGFRLYYIERATARLVRLLLLLGTIPVPVSLLPAMMTSSGGRLLLLLLLRLLLLLSLLLLLFGTRFGAFGGGGYGVSLDFRSGAVVMVDDTFDDRVEGKLGRVFQAVKEGQLEEVEPVWETEEDEQCELPVGEGESGEGNLGPLGEMGGYLFLHVNVRLEPVFD